MKRFLLSLVVAAMILSCQNDDSNILSKDHSVDVVLKVKAPQMNDTRSEGSNLDSGLGAIDNFDENTELWEDYDLRYILEIYEVKTEENATTTSEDPIYERQVLTTDRYVDNGVNFKMQLVPNRTYKFVVWADFVTEDSTEDLHYDTSDLHAISRKQSVAHIAMEETLDAYHISATEEIRNSTSIPLTLTRPFAKLRVVAIDYNEIVGYSTPTNIKVKFDTKRNPIYKTFNAINNEISNPCTTHEYEYSVNPAPYKEYSATTDKGENITGLVLFSDYILAQRAITEGEKNEQPVSFSMDIYDENNAPIRSLDFETQIPICRNYLTTIVGYCLTKKETIIVNINDTLLSKDEYNKDAEDVTQE